MSINQEKLNQFIEQATTWSLLEISHTEVLASVADHPNAYHFQRTSYCVAPEAWHHLDETELEKRVEVLLDAAYAKRNHTLVGSDDPTPMILLGYDFAWIAASERGNMPWTKAFYAFRIDNDGEHWHIMPWHDRDRVFADRLLSS